MVFRDRAQASLFRTLFELNKTRCCCNLPKCAEAKVSAVIPSHSSKQHLLSFLRSALLSTSQSQILGPGSLLVVWSAMSLHTGEDAGWILPFSMQMQDKHRRS